MEMTWNALFSSVALTSKGFDQEVQFKGRFAPFKMKNLLYPLSKKKKQPTILQSLMIFKIFPWFSAVLCES